MADGEAVATIREQLATLAESMRGMQSNMVEIKGEIRAERTSAQQSRARLYNRMDEMGKQHVKFQEDVAGLKENIADVRADMKTGIESVDKKVGEVKKVTDTVTTWQMVAIGIIGTFGFIAGAIGMALAYWEKIRTWLP